MTKHDSAQVGKSDLCINELLARLLDDTSSSTLKKYFLIISHQATLTGAPTVVQDLGRYLARLGIGIVYLMIETGTEIDSYRSIGDVYLLSEFANDHSKAIKNLVSRYQPIVAICNTITTTNYAAILKKELPSIYCFAWIHEMPTVINSFYGGDQTVQDAFQNCDKLLFGSEFVRAKFAKEYGLDLSKLSILPYIRNPLVFLSKSPETEFQSQVRKLKHIKNENDGQGKILIIGCGTAEPRKGLDTFVRVANLVINGTESHFVDRIAFEWYGCPTCSDNYADFCKLDARQLGLEKYITFMPVTPNFSKRLAQCTVFILTSREDPYPLVVLDSMASKVPFVCFEGAGGAADLAKIGAGVAVPYGDESAFAKQLVNIILDPLSRRRMGNAGLQRILQVNNWKNTVGILLKYSNELHTTACAVTSTADTPDSALSAHNKKTTNLLSNDSEKWLVISFGPPPLPHINAVEGGGLRCWNLAKGLKEASLEKNITLTYPGWYDKDDVSSSYLGVNLIRWQDRQELVAQSLLYDIIVISFCYGDYSIDIARSLNSCQRLILDCYVPIHVEICARRSPNREEEAKAYEIERKRWAEVLAIGDLYLCANEHQVHYYRGILYQIGRINPLRYDDDPLVLAPFGISRGLPAKKASPISNLGIPSRVKRLLWFGGVYPWFDIERLFEAIEILAYTVPCVLIVVGVRNPFNGHPDFIELATKIEDLAKSKRFNDLVFLADWVSYHDRADWYLDSDLTVMVSADGIENEYAWRTRLVDYLWAGVHVATSGQDLLSKQMVSAGLASYLNTGSAGEISKSLELALINSSSSKVQPSDSQLKLKEFLYIDNIGKDVLARAASFWEPKDCTGKA